MTKVKSARSTMILGDPGAGCRLNKYIFKVLIMLVNLWCVSKHHIGPHDELTFVILLGDSRGHWKFVGLVEIQNTMFIEPKTHAKIPFCGYLI